MGRGLLFGRYGVHYYKSGLGSGGLVNTRYVVGILDALKECEGVYLDEKLMGIYEDWIMENPYDEGQGWGTCALVSEGDGCDRGDA